MRNISEATRTARLQLETDDSGDDSWFSFDDAAQTNPQLFEKDFAAESSQSISIPIKAPGKDHDVSCKFRLRVTAEDDPDNDFVEGPWVALGVPRFEKNDLVVKKTNGWWKVAIAVVLAFVLSFALWKILFDGPEIRPEDGDYFPIVAVAPSYPQRAMARGIEGYVDLSFTVTTDGTVKDPVTIFTTSSLFERPATSARLQYKYEPRVKDGVPVEVPGVKVRTSFTIDD